MCFAINAGKERLGLRQPLKNIGISMWHLLALEYPLQVCTSNFTPKESSQFLQNVYRMIQMAVIIRFIQELEHRGKKAHLVLSCIVLFCPCFCGIRILFVYSEDALINVVTQLLGSIM